MNEVERYGSPIYREQPAPQLISRRLYNLVLTGFVVLSFVIMAACSYITGTREFLLFMVRNPMLVTVGSLVGSIGGIIAMSIGRSRENLTLGLIGYAFFSLTFGFTTSIALSAYDMESISMAFTATAGIMIVFGAAGFMFPDFFCRSSSRFSFSVRSRDFPLLSCVLPVRSKAPGCCCSASYFLRMRLNCSTVTPRCNNWDTMYCWSFPFSCCSMTYFTTWSSDMDCEKMNWKQKQAKQAKSILFVMSV